MKRYRVLVYRNIKYFHVGYVEVEAENKRTARAKVCEGIDEYQYKTDWEEIGCEPYKPVVARDLRDVEVITNYLE